MGADVFVTGSSEHNLVMIFPGDCNALCRYFSHAALKKFFYSTYCYGPLQSKKMYEGSAFEI